MTSYDINRHTVRDRRRGIPIYSIAMVSYIQRLHTIHAMHFHSNVISTRAIRLVLRASPYPLRYGYYAIAEGLRNSRNTEGRGWCARLQSGMFQQLHISSFKPQTGTDCVHLCFWILFLSCHYVLWILFLSCHYA